MYTFIFQAKGSYCYNGRFQNPGIARIGLTPHPPILAHWWISRQKVRKCDSRQWIKRAYSKILAKDCSKSWQKIVQIHQKNLGMVLAMPGFWQRLLQQSLPKSNLTLGVLHSPNLFGTCKLVYRDPVFDGIGT